jgi:transcriptional regulator with XRE-family HTH domain
MSTSFLADSLQSPQFATTRKRRARSLRRVELVDADICARIKQAREEAGLTQEHFGDLLNVTKRTVGYYEKEIVPWERMTEISDITGKPLRWLLHGDDWLSEGELAQLSEIRQKLDALLAAIQPAAAAPRAAKGRPAQRLAGRSKKQASRAKGRSRKAAGAGEDSSK